MNDLTYHRTLHKEINVEYTVNNDVPFTVEVKDVAKNFKSSGSDNITNEMLKIFHEVSILPFLIFSRLVLKSLFSELVRNLLELFQFLRDLITIVLISITSGALSCCLAFINDLSICLFRNSHDT